MIREGNLTPEKDTSPLLKSFGIEGITYDGGNNGRCFVVFEGEAVSIVKKHNQEAGIVREVSELCKTAEAEYPTIKLEEVGNLVREAIQTTLDFGEEAKEVFISDGKSKRRTETGDTR